MRMAGGQQETPYLDALCDYAARDPARLHIPGHKGGPGATAAVWALRVFVVLVSAMVIYTFIDQLR